MGLNVIGTLEGVRWDLCRSAEACVCDAEILGAVWHCIGVRYQRRHFINFTGGSKSRFTRVALMRSLAALGRRVFIFCVKSKYRKYTHTHERT